MDTYAKLKELDERVQAGELKLVEVMDELRALKAERFSRTQIVTATTPDEPAPKPSRKRNSPAASQPAESDHGGDTEPEGEAVTSEP